MGRIAIIKLGGSVITDKTVPHKIRVENIRKIALQLREYGKNNILLVHGGGSVGHYVVKSLGLDDATKSTLQGVARLSYEMDKLTNMIIEILLEEKIPAVSIPTHAILTTKRTDVAKIDLTPARIALSKGYVPIMRGDVVFDKESGYSIFSGDELTALLAERLHACRIIMLTDVDGIIGSNGETLRTLRISEPYEHLLWSSSTGFDVTGGISNKLSSLKESALKRIKIYILNPTKNDRLLHALLDSGFVGTEVIY